MNGRTQAQCGFSLVEILLAVALLGALLLALNIFIFSMGEIWGRRSEQRLFDQHVRAVTRHVEEMLRAATLARQVRPGAGRAVIPQELRLETGATEVVLAFELPEGDRVLPWPERPLPEVECALAAPAGRGLVLYWRSRLETRFAETPPRATVLTPFVAELRYEYYSPDYKIWQTETAPRRDREGQWLAPQGIRLRFGHGSMAAETRIMLPAPTGALPVF